MINKKKPLVAAAIVALTLSVRRAPAAAGNGQRNQIKTFMLNTGVDPAYVGWSSSSRKAQSFFMIKLTNMDPNSPYDVTSTAPLRKRSRRLVGRGNGPPSVALARTPTPLPYDPRGHTLSITEQGRSSDDGFPGDTAGGSYSRQDQPGPHTGDRRDRTATARFRRGSAGWPSNVEMMGSAPGSYDLLVAGVNVGSITVTLRNGAFTSTRGGERPHEGDGIDLADDLRSKRGIDRDPALRCGVFSGTFPLIP